MTAWSDEWDAIKITIHWLQELWEVCSIDGTNLAGLEATLQAAAPGNLFDMALSALRADRSKLSSIFTPANLQARLLPHLRNLGVVVGRPSTDPLVLMDEIRRYMVAQAPDETVKGRAITFASASAGGANVGNGTILRCTKDRYDYDLESTFVESKRLECDKDQGSTIRNQEEFIFKGAPFDYDLTKLVGSGQRFRPLKCVDARQAASWIKNPSFDLNDASADNTAPTSLTNWTIDSGSIANLRMRSSASYVFQQTQGVATNWGVEFTSNVTLGQILRNNANPVFLATVPYCVSLRVQRLASATGTLTLYCGSKSIAVDISGLTNGVWYHLYLGPGDENWYDNFREDDLNVQIAVTSLAVGTVAIDHLVVYPFTFVDGTYYCALSGSTPFVRDDLFTFADALSGAEAVIQYWLWRAGLPALPYAASPTIVDP